MEICALQPHDYIKGFKKLISLSTDSRIICVEMEFERVYDNSRIICVEMGSERVYDKSYDKNMISNVPPLLIKL